MKDKIYELYTDVEHTAELNAAISWDNMMRHKTEMEQAAKLYGYWHHKALNPKSGLGPPSRHCSVSGARIHVHLQEDDGEFD